ncbi:MAG: hypothetical protein WA623_20550 [Candidatus Sulfotelmatobacter sp.]
MTTLFGYTAVMPVAVPKKKRSLLPLLTVLFVISYGLMTVLIVEQGSVIQSQRNLIKILLPDSRELWTLKGKAIIDQQISRSQAQRDAQAPSTKTPSSQIPSTQVPSTQTPSTQAAPQPHSQGQAVKGAKPRTQVPPVPASDLLDQRRALITI